MTSNQTDNFRQARKVSVSAPAVQTSRLAVAALGLGLIAWAVPLGPAVVVVIAVSALVAMRKAPRRNLKLRGAGFAGVALLCGAAGLIAQGYLGYRALTVYQQLRCGPSVAITQGLEGNTAGFLEAFAEPSDRTDAAENFLGQLESRYGSLVHAKPKETAPLIAALGQESVTQTYRLQFIRGIVTAQATLQCPADDALSWPAVPRMQSLTILDPDRGPLVYPDMQLSGVQP